MLDLLKAYGSIKFEAGYDDAMHNNLDVSIFDRPNELDEVFESVKILNTIPNSIVPSLADIQQQLESAIGMPGDLFEDETEFWDWVEQFAELFEIHIENLAKEKSE